MPKRPSKRWAVEPGYDPPVTRLRAQKGAIILPAAHQVPLPPTRMSRVRRTEPAATFPPENADIPMQDQEIPQNQLLPCADNTVQDQEIPQNQGTLVADNPTWHLQLQLPPNQNTFRFMNTLSALRLFGPKNENPQSDEQKAPNQLPAPISPSPPPKRPLLVTEPPQPKDDILTERRFVSHPDFKYVIQVEKGLRFSVVSYNIRAELEREAGIEGEAGSTGSAGERIGRGGGGETGEEEISHPLLPDNYYTRLLQELSFLQSNIICLQSIDDCFWSRLEKNLYNWGYTASRMRRRRGPNNSSEAIFFRHSRFDLVKSYGLFLDDLIIKQSLQPGVIYHSGIRDSVSSPEVVAIVVLQCKKTGNRVKVACTRCIPEYQQRSDLQAAQVCAIVQQMATLGIDPDDRIPMILCGAMDFQPEEEPYQVLRDGCISEPTCRFFSSIDSVTISSGQEGSLVSVYGGGFHHYSPTIQSAYAKVLGSEPPTVWKRDSETLVCGNYVWFDEAKLSVVQVLKMVASKVITASGIPSCDFPSGSLSLKAIFQFHKNA